MYISPVVIMANISIKEIKAKCITIQTRRSRSEYAVMTTMSMTNYICVLRIFSILQQYQNLTIMQFTLWSLTCLYLYHRRDDLCPCPSYLYPRRGLYPCVCLILDLIGVYLPYHCDPRLVMRIYL